MSTTAQLQLSSRRFRGLCQVTAHVEEEEGRRYEVAKVTGVNYQECVELLREQGVKNLDVAYVRGPEGWEQPECLTLADALEVTEVVGVDS